ncbi:MAG TPA: SufD family Fe-S cluster assembly protein [Myxococcota bacterium]|nr:SufD family Fe-S cluster assembly protein [Myxococcota bacterium]
MLEPQTDDGWKAKLAAAARFEALGWPSTRLERWRYFSTKALHDLDLTTAPETNNVPLPPLPSPRIVFIDGRFAPHLLALEGCEDVLVRALSDYDDATRLALLARLTPGEGDGALEHANLAFLTDGLHLKVKKSTRAPLIHLVHLTTGEGVVHHRTILELEPFAELPLVVHHLGLARPSADGEARYLQNLVTECHLGEGSALLYGKHVAEGMAGNHIDSTWIRQAKTSRFSSFSLSLTGMRARTAITVDLAGEGAECQVDGLYLGHGQSVLDHMTDVRHQVPHTTSAETWAGVLDDQSTGTFQGLVKIASGAIKSQTRQLTRTLLLSEKAQANAKPELHIDCDDVAATHGASIGQLDPLMRFYLESRGLTPAESRRFLIGAFVKNVLGLAPPALAPTLMDAAAPFIGRDLEDRLEEEGS